LVVSFFLKFKNGEQLEITANTTKHIANRTPPTDSDMSFIKNYSRFKNLDFAIDNGEYDIDILIGSEYVFDIFTMEKIPVTKKLYLIGSKLGYFIGGHSSRIKTVSSNTVHCLLNLQSITNLWELDCIGIKDDPDQGKQEETALKAFYENITYTNGHYEVTWPWREFPPPVPENFSLAFAQLRTSVQKLKADMLVCYDKIIQQQLQEGMVEIVEFNQPENCNPCHYLPHHPVITPGKSTEIRIVYNASSKLKGERYTLNDCLYKGKTVLSDLCSLLLHFRFYPIGVVADIRRHFYKLA